MLTHVGKSAVRAITFLSLFWRRGWATYLAAFAILPSFQQHAREPHQYWRFLRSRLFQLFQLFRINGTNFGPNQTPKTPNEKSGACRPLGSFSVTDVSASDANRTSRRCQAQRPTNTAIFLKVSHKILKQNILLKANRTGKLHEALTRYSEYDISEIDYERRPKSLPPSFASDLAYSARSRE